MRTADVVLDGVSVRLIKIKNPKTGKDLVFATNLPKKNWSKKKIEQIYQLRWECETSNRDHTLSINMESLHSKSINGVLQELYASFILNNMLRLEAHENGGFEVSPDTPITKKVNFKFLVEMSFDWLEKIWFEKIEEFVNLMKILLQKIFQRERGCQDGTKERLKDVGSPIKIVLLLFGGFKRMALIPKYCSYVFFVFRQL